MFRELDLSPTLRLKLRPKNTMNTHREHLLNIAVKNDFNEFRLDLAKTFHDRYTFKIVLKITLTVFFIAVNHKIGRSRL